MTNIQIQLSIKSRTFVELSNKLIEGIIIENTDDEPVSLEYLRGWFLGDIRQLLSNAPLNDFLFSTLDEEGNIKEAI